MDEYLRGCWKKEFEQYSMSMLCGLIVLIFVGPLPVYAFLELEPDLRWTVLPFCVVGFFVSFFLFLIVNRQERKGLMYSTAQKIARWILLMGLLITVVGFLAFRSNSDVPVLLRIKITVFLLSVLPLASALISSLKRKPAYSRLDRKQSD